MIRFFAFLLLFSNPSPDLLAEEAIDLEFDVSSEVTIYVSHFVSNSSKLILWVPSERGVSSGIESVASQLANSGSDVWIADLHASYMIPTDRNSMAQFPATDILKLLLMAKNQGYEEIYFISAGKGAQLVLDTIYEFSSRFPESKLLKGSILIHPNLFRKLPRMGEKATFVFGSDTSHLPVYMIQTQFSTKFIHTQAIRKQLEKGGSQVFVHLLSNVASGFYSRPVDQLTGEDIKARQQFPGVIQAATRLLALAVVGQLPVKNLKSDVNEVPTPVSFQGNRTPRPLKLKDMQGNVIDLSDLRGNVVLVNFWASWCGPCVAEIPNLTRLGIRFGDRPFRILAVNIAESRNRVASFLRTADARFTVLLDETGEASRDWKIYAYPSNFLIDRQGQIQYAYQGVPDWESDEVIETIERLF